MAVDIVWLADLIALSRLPNASTPGFGRLLPAPFSPESPRLAPEVSSPLSEFALVLPLKLPFLLIKRAHYATWMHTTASSSTGCRRFCINPDAQIRHWRTGFLVLHSERPRAPPELPGMRQPATGMITSHYIGAMRVRCASPQSAFHERQAIVLRRNLLWTNVSETA
jgi:hypothetical protein